MAGVPNDEVSQSDPAELLERLASPRREEAWEEFLSRYSPLILRVLGLFEPSQDRVGDAYLFVCESLRQGDFRRLRSFRTGGSATFNTWLRAVVRNGFLDWRRQAHGRLRTFQKIRRLPVIDREVYRQVFELGASREEAFQTLQGEYPALTSEGVAEIVDRLHQTLSARQRWLLTLRRPLLVRLNPGPPGEGGAAEPADPHDDPEKAARQAELAERLRSALASLEPPQRLVVRLRYEQELTLREIAELLGLSSPQAAARRIESALEALRGGFEPADSSLAEESRS